ncbi:MAG: 2,3-bisphosphoglycerate-independent phosphoglycerate mutase [Eubacteriales bacterium]|nr:2,3-bisphosphoglycerate-independent phosphoglycerate mutase [Eubacteriales bacterium]MDY3332705.1 2,3-bisphosphoglycerate-independent phosphoglycerate mutase [Gallibacter sp.]
MQTNKAPFMLMILDGFGIGKDDECNAIFRAKTPFFDDMFKKYPWTTLGASGGDVGLPDGQMGNSEVGHLNIGAGRIVYQELTRISKSIFDEDFFDNKEFINAIKHIKKNDGRLHLMGLLSDGGVHSHIDHLKALVELAKRNDVEEVYIHAILDGRDVPPKSAETYIDEIQEELVRQGVGQIASLSGRFYTMDRDNRWERVSQAYDMLVSTDESADCNYMNVENFELRDVDSQSLAKRALLHSYDNDISDEFVEPMRFIEDAYVKSGDSFIFYNFRPDRAREITRAFTDKAFVGFERQFIDNLYFVTMTEYDATLDNVHIAFAPQKIKNTLGDVFVKNGIKQLRIAETEKYAHVTFFFNGGVEEPANGEDRILIPSPKVATYDMKPEMSAYELTDRLINEINNYDAIVINYANADMVGHTGDMDAAIKAIETLDNCVERVANAILECGGKILLIADHGNADVMLDGDNVVTAHSTNRVPCVLIVDDNQYSLRDGGRLADVAPTILDIMKFEKPAEMTGESLII